MHPYRDNFLENIVFSYKYFENIDSVNVEVIGIHGVSETEDKINNTLRDFSIEEMYNSHHPELRDLLKIKQAYSKNYLKSLKEIFPDANLTEQEVYRLAFGVELNPEDFHKRPMSKFKFDILKELGIL